MQTTAADGRDAAVGVGAGQGDGPTGDGQGRLGRAAVLDDAAKGSRSPKRQRGRAASRAVGDDARTGKRAGNGDVVAVQVERTAVGDAARESAGGLDDRAIGYVQGAAAVGDDAAAAGADADIVVGECVAGRRGSIGLDAVAAVAADDVAGAGRRAADGVAGRAVLKIDAERALPSATSPVTSTPM